MDLIYDLVKHALKTRYEDLPPRAVEGVKKTVIDTLGCLIAGSSAPGCKDLVDVLRDWGGKAEGNIMVYGGKVPATSAVQANCTMSRALDLDDVHEGGEGKGTGGHLSATFVPVMLGVCELVGRPVSGKDFILANAIGSDLSCRLRIAVKTYQGWLAETFAPFGIVAGGGRLMGFDEEKMLNGMGIGYSHCSCNAQSNADAAMTIRLQQGFGGRAGVVALVLAEKGFTGARNVMQGTYGFYPLYCRNDYDPAIIKDKLGQEFEVANVSVKPYPCCKCTHGGIDGVIAILKENNLRPDQVEEVVLTMNTWGYKTVGEGAGMYEPRTVMDAQFSAPYTAAVAMIKGDVFIGDFTAEAIKDRKVLDLAKRVKVRIDPELDKVPSTPPGIVDMKTKDGKRYSKRVDYVKGHPKNPMSMAELVQKFRKCLPFSARPIPEANAAKLISLVEGLEEIKDVREIVRQLA